MADDSPEADSTGVEPPEPGAEDAAPTAPPSRLRLGAWVGAAVVVVLAGVTGWLGYQAYEAHRADQKRDMFLQTGRQVALNLTSVSWETVDADVQRLLDSASGKFYDDFQKRSQSYADVVRQVQSKSEGTVTGAALESVSDSEAKVLVSITVRSQNAGVPQQAPQYWRMMLTVQENGGQAKVSEVEFAE
ncbi:Mce protein [Mycobacterium sp. NPDC003449]